MNIYITEQTYHIWVFSYSTLSDVWGNGWLPRFRICHWRWWHIRRSHTRPRGCSGTVAIRVRMYTCIFIRLVFHRLPFSLYWSSDPSSDLSLTARLSSTSGMKFHRLSILLLWCSTLSYITWFWELSLCSCSSSHVLFVTSATVSFAVTTSTTCFSTRGAAQVSCRELNGALETYCFLRGVLWFCLNWVREKEAGDDTVRVVVANLTFELICRCGYTVPLYKLKLHTHITLHYLITFS